MYELLNIRNKFKGNRFYYCNFLVTNYYEVQPILRKIYIRMATYVGDNIILVGQDFRIELPIKQLVTNKSFAIQIDKYTIISTQKQEIERFIKHYYSKGTNVRERWNNKSYYSSNSKRKYNTLLQQLKRL